MTREEIMQLSADECEERKAAIRSEMDAEGADYAALSDEADAVIERLSALKEQAETRASLAAKVAAGEVGTVTKQIKEDKPMEETRSFGIESVEYRNAWLKNLQRKELSAEERTALANGSYVIPTETANLVKGKMELYPLLNAVDVMHIPGFVIVPVEGTVNNAAVVAMGTAANDSADTMGQVALNAYKLIKTLEITADVAAMAIPAFEGWLVDRLANKIYRLATAKIAAGTGTNEPTGLTTITQTGTYTKAAMTYADLMTIIGALPSEYAPGAAFVMSRTTFFGQVLGLTDTAKHPVVVADAQAPAKFNILGFPVILEDALGTDVIFGDLKEGYVWNFGMDVTIERDTSAGFRAGSVVFRGMALADGKPTGVGLVRYAKAAS